MEKKFAAILFFLIAGCSAPIIQVSPSFFDPKDKGNSVKVTEITAELDAGGTQSYYYRFAPGDKVEVFAHTLQGNGFSKVGIIKNPDNIIFLDKNTLSISQSIPLQEKSTLGFLFSSGDVFSSNKYKMVIYRSNNNPKYRNFNTEVSWATDTITENIADTKIKLWNDLGVGGNSKNYISIDIPKGTDKWAYWIGVGQDADKRLEESMRAISSTSTIFIGDPFIAFAVGKIPDLVKLTSGRTINYYLIETGESLSAFNQGRQFNALKEQKNVESDYARMDPPSSGRIFLAFENDGAFKTKDIVVKVVAVRYSSRIVE